MSQRICFINTIIALIILIKLLYLDMAVRFSLLFGRGSPSPRVDDAAHHLRPSFTYGDRRSEETITTIIGCILLLALIFYIIISVYLYTAARLSFRYGRRSTNYSSPSARSDIESCNARQTNSNLMSDVLSSKVNKVYFSKLLGKQLRYNFFNRITDERELVLHEWKRAEASSEDQVNKMKEALEFIYDKSSFLGEKSFQIEIVYENVTKLLTRKEQWCGWAANSQYGHLGIQVKDDLVKKEAVERNHKKPRHICFIYTTITILLGLMFYIVSISTGVAVSPRKVHKVFLNFRGEQLRYNFVSHLTDAFKMHRIDFFIDDKEQRGQDLKNLFVRIEESSIALAIFSTGYSNSSWCLDELVKMKKLVEQKKLIVIPIFFKVEPKDVRNPTRGSEFGRNFWALAELVSSTSSKDKIPLWLEALTCICDKMGLSLGETRYESNFIKEIVEKAKSVKEAIALEEDNKPVSGENVKEKVRNLFNSAIKFSGGFNSG